MAAAGHSHSHGGPHDSDDSSSLTSSNERVVLNGSIDTKRATLLNGDSHSNLAAVLSNSSNSPASIIYSDKDVDAQLLILLPFSSPVRIHSLKLFSFSHSDAEFSAPKVVKVFCNQPNLSFADVESATPTAELTLSAAAASGGAEHAMKLSKFHNVSFLSLFVESNQKDSAVTYINKIEIVGTSIEGMNVSNLKKVEGS
jgi:hypothetical protein